MSENNEVTRQRLPDGTVLLYKAGALIGVEQNGQHFRTAAKAAEKELRRQIITAGKDSFLFKTVEYQHPKKADEVVVFVHPLFSVDAEQASKYPTVESDGKVYGIKRCALRLNVDDSNTFVAGLQRAFPSSGTAAKPSPAVEAAPSGVSPAISTE